MGSKAQNKREGRIRRMARVRKKIRGNETAPRFNVFRSTRHMMAQLIDDDNGATLVTVTTTSKEFIEKAKEVKGKTAQSELLGKVMAEKAIEKGIKKVRFDRAGFAFHGRVRACAQGAREGGLDF